MSTIRDDLRAKLLATKRPKTIPVDFFGEKIELRQPTLGDILKARDNEDRTAAVVEILVSYAYIPGSDERIFESGDSEALLAMPFGGDFVAVTKALETLTAVNFLGASTSSETTQQPSGSAASGTA
jgi:hypothetical protein